jgi:hypothetical protein
MRELFRKTFRQFLYNLHLFVGRPQNAIKAQGSAEPTVSEAYWSMHTIHSKPLITANESLHYLEERFKEYPLYRELMDVWGKHDGEVLMDYGCGPGNDLEVSLHTLEHRR